jgi:phosphatidylserine/phosphatidylglycerophosphate/cardiolipin synthase-like enzyme
LNEFLARMQDRSFTCPDEARGFVTTTIDRLRAEGELPLRVDCRFGHHTELLARAFQACFGLQRDGRIGPRTWTHLDTFAPTSPTPGPPIDDLVGRWRAVLGPTFRDGNNVVELIDGPETFRAMLSAMRTATGEGHYIYLLGWWLDLAESLDVPPPPGSQCPSSRGGPATVRALFTSASEAQVQVRAVLWDQIGTKNSAEVRFINSLTNGAAVLDNHQLAPTLGAHHQKVLVVKGERGLVAFCGGIDINCDRICPAGVCPGGGSGGSASANNAGQPHHDVHCAIAGPSAHDVLGVFIKRWMAAADHEALDRRRGPLKGLGEPVPSAVGHTLVRIGETFNATARLPGGVRRTFRDRSVQEILLAVIGAARQFLYIEDQYLIGMCAAEAIRRAMPALTHVTILIAPSELLPGLNLPRRWELRRAFIDHIRASADGHKLRVFTPMTPGRHGEGQFGPHTYVHAKTLIADDEMAVIGSANVNRRGWEHDSEVVAAIGGPYNTAVARKLRLRLWAEHLAVSEAAVSDPIASKDLWLTAPTRRVRPYDPLGGKDPLWEQGISVDTIDPGMPLAAAPCCVIHGPSCPGASSPVPIPSLAPTERDASPAFLG